MTLFTATQTGRLKPASTDHNRKGFALFFAALSWIVIPAGTAAAQQKHLTVAVLDLEAERELGPVAKQVTELVASGLSASPDLILVERQRLSEALGELELTLAGLVDPDSAVRLGRILGARVLVTGRMFSSGDNVVVVARAIGTETGRVYAESVSADAHEPPGKLAAMLVARLSSRLKGSRGDLIAPPETKEDRLRTLTALVKGRTLPSVSISIPERHAGRTGLDPAAETEIARLLGSLGFQLLDPRSSARPDIQITGEAFSDVGVRRGNLVSAAGRVEIKAIDRRSHIVVAVDRQTEVAIDLSGEMAGKKALQQASLTLSDRLVRALVASSRSLVE